MATTGRIVYHGDDETIKKDKREFSLTDEIMELINSGGGGDAINGVKVNGQVVNPDQAGYVGLTIPGVINNLSSNSTTDALSAKQGKVLYEYIQALQHVGHFLALWNTATGLPVTNPETSPYNYNTGDYYIVSNIAAGSGTNYKPNGSSYTINVASTTVESGEVQVNDIYFYDGYERRLLDNSGGGSSIAVDSSLSTTSANPVQNAVITNRLNQMALDANTKTFFLANGNDLTTAQAAYDWITQGKMALVTFNGETYIYKTTASNKATFEDVGGYTTIDNNGTTGVYLKALEFSLNGTTVEQISLSTKSQSSIIPSYLATDKNYATVYTPQYDGSPATKKYVDDKFSAVPVYTAGSNIDITSNQISTIRNGYVYVTCNDAASTKAKTGTSAEGNYTPQEGDLIMIHFVNGCSVGGPTIAIDGGSAIPFYIGVDGANAGNMYFGSTNVSKMFIYTNGRLVGDAVKDNNNTYSAGTGLALSNGVFSNTQPGPTVSATAPANPNEGDMWYDTDNDVLKVYNGSSWDEAGGGEQECYTGGTDIEIVPGGRLHNLPTGYTELEYVTATGDQLITLNLTGDAVVDFKAQGVTPMDASNVLFDSSESGSVGYYYGGLTTDNGIWAYTTIPFYTDVTGHLSYVGNAVEGTVGSSSVSRSRETTITRGTWTLFGTMSQTTGYKFPFYGKLYYFKATQNGLVTYNLIPAKNSNDVAGLYDIVNNVFYTSSRTALTAGPVATEGCSVINYVGNKSNVKAFFLEDDEDTTTAAEMLGRWAEGTIGGEQRYPIIYMGGKTYLMSAGGGFRGTATMTLRFINVEPERDVIGYSRTELSQDAIEISGTIDTETFAASNVTIETETNILGDFLEAKAGGTYINPRTPTYDGDPTTKKYVDDKVSGAISRGTTAPSNPVEGQLWYDTTNDALKVYDGTNWTSVSSGGADVVEVTVSSASGATAKVGTTTAGNYTPSAGDFLLVTFTNGYYAGNATLDIDNSGAKYVKIGSTNVTADRFELSAGGVVMMYYDGAAYQVWTTKNTMYGNMTAAQAEAGTATTGMTISPAVLKGAVQTWATTAGSTAPSSPTEGQLWYDTTNDELKVYDGTTWNTVGGSGGVNITDVTVATAYNTAAKVGTTTAGNYTPTAGDFIMVNFVNGCSVSTPTLNIDGSGAKNIRTGNASATTSTLALGSTANSNIKMLMYYDGTYYRTWSTSNNTYSGMSQSTASTGTSTTSSLISAKVLNDTIKEKAITLDPNSPLDVTTIWAGTETQYNALATKGATTAYLCVED